MTAQGNLTKRLPQHVLDGWPGCVDQDCLPGCWHGLEDGHCERLAKWVADRRCTYCGGQGDIGSAKSAEGDWLDQPCPRCGGSGWR